MDIISIHIPLLHYTIYRLIPLIFLAVIGYYIFNALVLSARRFIDVALHIAVRQRSKPLVIQALLRLHADCGARNSDGDTALLAALRKGDLKYLLEIVQLLIIRSNPADCDKEGNTACHLAVRLVNNYDVFAEIVAHCSLFLETANSSGQVVLYCATVHRNIAAVELLLKYDVDMYKKARDTEDTRSIIATVLAERNVFMQRVFAIYINESSRRLDPVSYLDDPEPTRRFSAYTTPANELHITVASDRPCFTYRGLTISSHESGYRHCSTDFSHDQIQSYIMHFPRNCTSQSTREERYFIQLEQVPPLNWANSLRAIWAIPSMILCDVADSFMLFCDAVDSSILRRY